MVTAEYERPGGRDGQQLLVELAARTAAAAVDTGMWQAWLADPDTRRRFGALVYRRGHDHCAFWLGATRSLRLLAGSDQLDRPRQIPRRVPRAGPGGSQARNAEPHRVRARLRLPAVVTAEYERPGGRDGQQLPWSSRRGPRPPRWTPGCGRRGWPTRTRGAGSGPWCTGVATITAQDAAPSSSEEAFLAWRNACADCSWLQHRGSLRAVRIAFLIAAAPSVTSTPRAELERIRREAGTAAAPSAARRRRGRPVPIGGIARYEGKFVGPESVPARVSRPEALSSFQPLGTGAPPGHLASVRFGFMMSAVRFASVEVRADELRAGEDRTDEVRVIEGRAGEVRAGEGRVGEVRAGEVSGEGRAGEVRVDELRVDELRVGEVRDGEARMIEGRAGAASLTAAANPVPCNARSLLVLVRPR